MFLKSMALLRSEYKVIMCEIAYRGIDVNQCLNGFIESPVTADSGSFLGRRQKKAAYGSMPPFEARVIN